MGDVWPVAEKVFDDRLAGNSVTRATAPDLLKVPVAAKRVLQNSDVAIVFLTVAREDKDALFLVYEKMIDVELATNKYVFFAVLEEREWSRPSTIPDVARTRLEAVAELVSLAQQGSTEISSSIGSGVEEATGELSVFSMFASEQNKGLL